MHSPAENTTTTLPDSILLRILESIYADFLESVESSISEHHCSLLHPCDLISKSTTFNVFYQFRLVASKWNQVFLGMAKRDQYASYQVVQGPQKYQTFIYTLLRRSVIFRKYRIFHTLDKEHGTYSIPIPNPFFVWLTIPDYRGVFIAYDFGVTGGCKQSREVIIKAWMRESEDREIEIRAYRILSASPMKGFPSVIENREEDSIENREEDSNENKENSIGNKEDSNENREDSNENKENSIGNKEDSNKDKEDSNENKEDSIENGEDSIEDKEDSDNRLYALVLEKLGPSLEDLYQLLPGKKRFDEKMTLAFAIQMVRDFPS